MLLDFEVKHKGEVERPQGLTVGIPVPPRDQPLITDEIPVESGSVLRQKNEIEMKYGSSPRQSKLSPDPSLCPSSSSSDAARLTPTLERYCTGGTFALTQEVPEGFVDEDDGKDVQECDWPAQLQNDLPEPCLSPGASSQFQRSFSYRESCLQKQPKTSFVTRSASLRLPVLTDTAKSNSVVAYWSGSLGKTASCSSTEVCRRLLKEMNQRNECALNNKACELSSENTRLKEQHLSVVEDKQILLSNVLNTMQLPSHEVQVGSQTESLSGFGDTNCSGNSNLSHTVKATESVPVVSEDCQSRPRYGIASQQFASSSGRTDLSAAGPLEAAKDLSVTSGGSECRTLEDISADAVNVPESSLELSDDNKIQSQSAAQQLTWVDVSAVADHPAVDSIEPLSSDQTSETSGSTDSLSSHSDDVEQWQLSSEFKKRFSFSAKSSPSFTAEPGKLCRSQSVRDKSWFVRQTSRTLETAETRKVKKPYGRSHPLSKLPSEYLSRDCSANQKPLL